MAHGSQHTKHDHSQPCAVHLHDLVLFTTLSGPSRRPRPCPSVRARTHLVAPRSVECRRQRGVEWRRVSNRIIGIWRAIGARGRGVPASCHHSQSSHFGPPSAGRATAAQAAHHSFFYGRSPRRAHRPPPLSPPPPPPLPFHAIMWGQITGLPSLGSRSAWATARQHTR